MRERTFLERPEWKTVPWSSTWISKTAGQKLLDVVADLPGLLQDWDRVSTFSFDSGDNPVDWLLKRLLSTLRRLFLWRWWWEELYPDVAFLINVEPAAHLELLGVKKEHLQRSISFTDFSRAYELVLYDSALVIALNLAEHWLDEQKLSDILTDLAQVEPNVVSSQPLLIPGQVKKPKQVVEETYRCVSYFLQRGHARSGAFAIVWPLWSWCV